MQAKERLPAAGVIDHLFENPAKYQFRQALRILLLWLRSQGVSYDDAFKHVLRFQNSVALGFPASEIEALRAELAEPDDPADYIGEPGPTGWPGVTAGTSERAAAPSAAPERIVLTPAFIGLLGVSGSLPFHY